MVGVVVGLSGQWSFLPPSAFDHSVTKQLLPQGWDNRKCTYSWQQQGELISFASPLGCVGDRWAGTPARGALSGAPPMQRLQLSFVFPATKTTPERNVTIGGSVSPTSDFIDMDDGALWSRGAHPIDQAPHEWLRGATAWLVRAATVVFSDGSRHLEPAYSSKYRGFWMRDGYYVSDSTHVHTGAILNSYPPQRLQLAQGIASAWDLANATMREQHLASFEWLLSHARPDGILPAACPPPDDPATGGRCTYGQWWAPVDGTNPSCNDTVGAPGWRACYSLDTASFAIKLADQLWGRAGSMPNRTRAKELQTKWGPALLKSLDATATAPDGSGLLWSNTSTPIIGYGFRDAEIISGSVLYSSVLAWNASRLLAGMALELGGQAGDALAEQLRGRADKIKVSADAQLWNEDKGVTMQMCVGTLAHTTRQLTLPPPPLTPGLHGIDGCGQEQHRRVGQRHGRRGWLRGPRQRQGGRDLRVFSGPRGRYLLRRPGAGELSHALTHAYLACGRALRLPCQPAAPWVVG